MAKTLSTTPDSLREAVTPTPMENAFSELLSAFAHYLHAEGVCDLAVNLFAQKLPGGAQDPEKLFGELVEKLNVVNRTRLYRAEDVSLRGLAMQLDYVLNIENDGDRHFLFERALSNSGLFVVTEDFPAAAQISRMQLCFIQLFEAMGQLAHYSGYDMKVKSFGGS
jgi:hypothetical protein